MFIVMYAWCSLPQSLVIIGSGTYIYKPTSSLVLFAAVDDVISGPMTSLDVHCQVVPPTMFCDNRSRSLGFAGWFLRVSVTSSRVRWRHGKCIVRLFHSIKFYDNRSRCLDIYAYFWSAGYYLQMPTTSSRRNLRPDDVIHSTKFHEDRPFRPRDYWYIGYF